MGVAATIAMMSVSAVVRSAPAIIGYWRSLETRMKHDLLSVVVVVDKVCPSGVRLEGVGGENESDSSCRLAGRAEVSFHWEHLGGISLSIFVA